MGLIDFVTPSDGSKPTPAPKFYRKGDGKVCSRQKAVSRRKLGLETPKRKGEEIASPSPIGR